jgi:hypothetical protein
MSTLSNPPRESDRSSGFRRSCGFLALSALGVAAAGLIVGLGSVALTGFLIFWTLPYAVMVGHLNLTSALTHEEKKLWRRELWWNHRSTVAVWAYLFARDLGERARGFAPYRGERQAG